MNKLYTLQQANAALSLVNPIVSGIQQLQREGQKLLRRKQELESRSDADPYDLSAVLEELSWAEDDALRLQQEVDSLGIEIKDIPRGRVDFYSSYNGRMVYLAWQQGEDRIRKWRELNQPFVMRVDIEDGEEDKFHDTFSEIPDLYPDPVSKESEKN